MPCWHGWDNDPGDCFAVTDKGFQTMGALLLAALWALALGYGHFNGDVRLLGRAEAALTDLRLLSRGERPAPDLITIVAIDLLLLDHGSDAGDAALAAALEKQFSVIAAAAVFPDSVQSVDTSENGALTRLPRAERFLLPLKTFSDHAAT